MNDLQTLIRAQYVQRQLLTRRAVLASKRLWKDVDPKAIRATWHGSVGPRMTAMVTGAQTEAASQADPNVTAALTAQKIDPSQAAQIVPAAFAGQASDGRDLATLLELSNVYALQQIKLGATPAQGLAFGGRWLGQTVGLQVLDAARAAASVSITVRHHSVGYIRDVGGSCCARCAVLAGRWYRYNADFARHVSCQCTQIPASDEGSSDLIKSPEQLFNENRITGLSRSDAQAIRDGADVGQVINAHRGMYTAGGRSFTREGVTKHGFAGQRIRSLGSSYSKIPRLTPEQIYRDATSREQALEFLYRFGYIK